MRLKAKETQGTSIKGITSAEIKSIKLYLPNTYEQEKIAQLLQLIDDRISTQTQIIDNLQSLIKGISKKLFSQKIRFKDDNRNNFPNWEIRELGKVMSIPKKIKPIYIDKNKLLTVKLHLKGISKNESTETLSFGATNYFIRRSGQFIYGKQNLFNGAFGLISDEFDGFLSSGDVPALDINAEKLNGNFLVSYFSRESFYKKLEDIASGSGSKRIHEATLLNLEISIPTLEEQNKIADFFSVFNVQLETEKEILQKYIEQKKYLLANMFI
jgi:type I restriction enzyme S subunit